MAPIIGDVYALDNPTGHANNSNCYCPACAGLECLERPRYFAGQLLTEAELNSEQAYVIAKNRLHNRYLHGWGTVCGLQVVCNDCSGWVTVKQGYALDPCGNDIIVCDDQPFDVIKAIRECRDGRRRRRRMDCDPVKLPDDPSCKDVEEHWCITLAYEEKEARPTTALRPEKGGSCGCGCNGKSKGNGNGGGCGCGCHGQRGVASYGKQSVQAKSGVGTTVGACEPTRIFERYRLGVVEDECCEKPSKIDETLLLKTRYKYLLALPDGLRKFILKLLRTAPANSAYVRIINCLTGMVEFIAKRIPEDELKLLRYLFYVCLARHKEEKDPVPQFSGDFDSASMHSAKAAEPGASATTDAGGEDDVIAHGDSDVFAYQTQSPPPPPPKEDPNIQLVYKLCCHLHRVVQALYDENPLNVRCDSSCPPCVMPPKPPQWNSNDEVFAFQQKDPDDIETYIEQILPVFCCLFERLIEYAVNCICGNLLPPCPASPQDDRLILACVTIKNDKIVDICNFSCRHYAGSFPAVNYWLSLVPVIPLIMDGLRHFCCDEDLLAGLHKLIFEQDSTNFSGESAEMRMQGSRWGLRETILTDVFNPFRKRAANFRRGFNRFADGAESESDQRKADEMQSLRDQLAVLKDEVEALKQKP